ncbi:MAG: DMT family transporter [Sphaerochaetaceae bacterium]|nr:DMT family transporter [Sphaerochaetaceae bacterium]
MKEKTEAIINVLLCVFLWSLIPVTAKIGQTSLDTIQYLSYSSFTSFVTLTVISLVSGRIVHVLTYSLKDWLVITCLGLLGTFVYYLLLYFGYSKAGAIEVLIIQYTWPFLIVLLSRIILKEKIGLSKLISVILGFAGVLSVLSAGDISTISISSPQVLLWVFIGALCFALFSVLSKRVEKEPVSLTAVYYLAATAASAVTLMMRGSFIIPQGSQWLSILINGMFINGISYLLWIRALRLAEASFVAPFVYIVPVLSAIYLVIFFREPMYITTVAGFILVVTAGLVNSLRSK